MDIDAGAGSSARVRAADAQSIAILEELIAHPKRVKIRAKQMHALFPDDERVVRWSLEGRRFVAACGCKTSAALALILGPAGLIYALLQPSGPWFVAVLRAVLGLIAGFLIGAIIGKAVGLLRARHRFVSHTRVLLKHISAQSAP